MRKEQKQIDDWLQQYKTPYWSPMEIMVRLTEEVGELAREVNHGFGPKKKKSSEETKEIGDEVADCLFTLICLCNSLKIDLDEAFDRMMKKVTTRDNNRFEKK